MARRMGGVSILAGLAVFGAMLAGGPEARALGIIITSGTTQQTGDPTYEYLFDMALTAGSTLQNGGYITVYDLPGIPATALTSQPNISWGSAIQKLGKTPTGAKVPFDDPSVFNVTWQWNGSSPIVAGTSNLDLGTFIVGSTTELTSPPTATLYYVSSLNGVTAADPNPGTVGITIVPEPTSVLLLLAGAGAIPLFALRARRRRQRDPGVHRELASSPS